MAVTPDPGLNADNDLRSLGDALMRISRILHEHTRKLEVAVEGTFAGQASDERVRLLSDSLRVCRTADLELSRFSQAGQRVINSLREQLEQAQVFAAPSPSRPLASPQATSNASVKSLILAFLIFNASETNWRLSTKLPGCSTRHLSSTKCCSW